MICEIYVKHVGNRGLEILNSEQEEIWALFQEWFSPACIFGVNY